MKFVRCVGRDEGRRESGCVWEGRWRRVVAPACKKRGEKEGGEVSIVES
jgi:hypothetical protein